MESADGQISHSALGAGDSKILTWRIEEARTGLALELRQYQRTVRCYRDGVLEVG